MACQPRKAKRVPKTLFARHTIPVRYLLWYNSRRIHRSKITSARASRRCPGQFLGGPARREDSGRIVGYSLPIRSIVADKSACVRAYFSGVSRACLVTNLVKLPTRRLLDSAQRLDLLNKSRERRFATNPVARLRNCYEIINLSSPRKKAWLRWPRESQSQPLCHFEATTCGT